uniref:right-handed parallel beta-helix repeat-containing protein n=1 Tax=uncultured Methanobrevibacter sp. TaxID=253161 RepID=UPI0025E9E8A0
MNNKSILYALILLITLALTLGVVSAADSSNETLSLSIDSAPIVDIDYETTNEELVEEPVKKGFLSASNEDDELSADSGTFSDLEKDLKGSYVTLNKDYVATENKMVQISTNSMTIDGQGHYIDGGMVSRILYIKSGSTVTLKNINFINGFHNFDNVQYGAAITVASGAKVIMENCTVSNCVGSYGAVVWQGNDGVINNSIFYKNNATLDAGALFVNGSNVNVLNSIFVENTAGRDGGALVYTSGSSNSNVDNCTFQRNNASKGGGAVIDGVSNSVTNSQFLSNHAVFGGGALIEQGTNNLIDNCIIYNNTAITYAGGASINTGTISNSIVESNNAIFGAGIYVIEGLIRNVTFTDNNGTVGQDIAVINESTISDSSFNYIEYYNLTDYISVKEHYGQYDYMILQNGDTAYCIEEGAQGPAGGYVDTSLNLLINHKTGENVAEYVKLLIYNNLNEKVLEPSNTTIIARDIWNFTETDFRNNPDASSRVKDAIRRYDAGERVPNTNAVKQVNGEYLVYNFYTVLTVASSQNLFSFNITKVNNINPDLEVRKITLNKTVNVGEKTSFDIIVKNTGDVGLTNVSVKELSYEGLIYNSFTGDNWVNTGNVFKYLNSLEIGDSASFTVEFNTNKPGNFTNIVVADSSETEEKITNNTTEVVEESQLKPGMVVDKVSLTPSVLVGEQTLFLITVTNTGEVD